MSDTPWSDAIREALFEKSGRVVDTRRLVAVIYLLIRDCLPVNRVSNALVIARTHEWKEQITHLDPDTIQLVRDWAARVHDEPGPRLYVFMHALRLDCDTWRVIDSTLPLRDDIHTHFSNGWVARYAQHVVDTLDSDS